MAKKNITVGQVVEVDDAKDPEAILIAVTEDKRSSTDADGKPVETVTRNVQARVDFGGGAVCLLNITPSSYTGEASDVTATLAGKVEDVIAALTKAGAAKASK